VDDRFYENHEHHALSSEQNNTLRLKCIQRGHVGNTQGGGGKDGKGGGKSSHAHNIKSIQHTSDALDTKFDKFNLPDDDDDDMLEDEDGADVSNHSNQALTCQTKKRGGVRFKPLSSYSAPGICWPSERSEQIGP
jgi:hypothetical protein